MPEKFSEKKRAWWAIVEFAERFKMPCERATYEKGPFDTIDEAKTWVGFKIVEITDGGFWRTEKIRHVRRIVKEV